MASPTGLRLLGDIMRRPSLCIFRVCKKSVFLIIDLKWRIKNNSMVLGV